MRNAVMALVERDGLKMDEAKQIVRDLLADIRELIEEGEYMEAEELWSDETGLEPDYLYACFGF